MNLRLKLVSALAVSFVLVNCSPAMGPTDGGTGGGSTGGSGGNAGGSGGNAGGHAGGSAGSGGSGGTGGGTGGSGGTGGGAPTCVQLTAFPVAGDFGGYMDTNQPAPYDHKVIGVQFNVDPMNSPDGGHSELWVEVWSDGNSFPSLPASRTFDTMTAYSACDVCVGLDVGCNDQGCDESYFAQGGSTAVTDYVQNADVGHIAANGSTLHFVNWDYSNDVATADGRCIDLTVFNMDISWNSLPDAGQTDGGPSPDGGPGLDGGTPGDGGTLDDGGSVDAG